MRLLPRAHRLQVNRSRNQPKPQCPHSRVYPYDVLHGTRWQRNMGYSIVMLECHKSHMPALLPHCVLIDQTVVLDVGSQCIRHGLEMECPLAYANP